QCGNVCVNTSSDPLHCGGCNTPCPFGDTCNNGVCACSGTVCMQNGNSICSDLKDDPYDCGSCGTFCISSRTYCSGGSCKCKPGFTLCGQLCVQLNESFTNCGACGNNCGAKGFNNPKCDNGVCIDGFCPMG